MKNIPLALDYGENQQSNVYDITSTTIFWNEMDDDVKKLNQIDIAELTKLSDLRNTAIQPFEHTLPEVVKVSEIFNDFKEVEKTLDKFKEAEKSKRSRKEVLQVCRDYLKTNTSSYRRLDDELSSISSIIQSSDKPSTSKSVLKRLSKLENSSDSDSEMDLLKICYQ
jgi:hypothetical protein